MHTHSKQGRCWVRHGEDQKLQASHRAAKSKWFNKAWKRCSGLLFASDTQFLFAASLRCLKVWLEEPYSQQQGVTLACDVCISSLNCDEQPCKVTLSASLMHRQMCQKELICLAVTENVGLFLCLYRAVPQMHLSFLVAKNNRKKMVTVTSAASQR